MNTHDVVELLLGHLAHRGVAGEAGVVHPDIQRTNAIDGGGRCGRDVVGAGDVTGCGEDVAEAVQIVLGSRQCVGGHVGEHDAGALA